MTDYNERPCELCGFPREVCDCTDEELQDYYEALDHDREEFERNRR